MTVGLVGLVVVSHSRALADAAVALAMQMVHGEAPPVEVAAGMPDGGLGTDAMAVMDAITRADAGAGVVVLVDLGSAVLSAEMAVEFLDDAAPELRVVPAPFVEGLVAAVVRSAGGADLDEVAAEACQALTPKLHALGRTNEPIDVSEVDGWTPESSVEAVLPNPAGLHARPAAMIAATAAKFDAEIRLTHPHAGSVRATSPIGLATLNARQGDPLQIGACGPDAAEAVLAITALIKDGFGEMTVVATPSVPRNASTPLGVSAGRIVGSVHKMTEPMTAPPAHVRVSGPAMNSEAARLGAALEEVIAGYLHRAEEGNPLAAEILSATAAMAGDPSLLESAEQLVFGRGLDAPNAFWHAASGAAQAMAEAGGMVAERAVDIADIRDRVISQLLGIPMPGIVDPGHPFILVARDLAPSETATLDGATCLGIVTSEGGPTSHTSILARGMGIPAVVGYATALDIPDGATILVDGSTGEIIIEPGEE